MRFLCHSYRKDIFMIILPVIDIRDDNYRTVYNGLKFL